MVVGQSSALHRAARQRKTPGGYTQHAGSLGRRAWRWPAPFSATWHWAHLGGAGESVREQARQGAALLPAGGDDATGALHHPATHLVLKILAPRSTSPAGASAKDAIRSGRQRQPHTAALSITTGWLRCKVNGLQSAPAKGAKDSALISVCSDRHTGALSTEPWGRHGVRHTPACASQGL